MHMNSDGSIVLGKAKRRTGPPKDKKRTVKRYGSLIQFDNVPKGATFIVDTYGFNHEFVKLEKVVRRRSMLCNAKEIGVKTTREDNLFYWMKPETLVKEVFVVQV